MTGKDYRQDVSQLSKQGILSEMTLEYFRKVAETSLTEVHQLRRVMSAVFAEEIEKAGLEGSFQEIWNGSETEPHDKEVQALAIIWRSMNRHFRFEELQRFHVGDGGKVQPDTGEPAQTPP